MNNPANWKVNAENAVLYVQSKMQIGADNKGVGSAYGVGMKALDSLEKKMGPGVITQALLKVKIDASVDFRTYYPAGACVSSQRGMAGDRLQRDPKAADPRNHYDYWWIKAIASGAATSGCGNCGEQSALAFDYLVQHGIHPLDYMYRRDGDHVFVLIGRDLGTDVTRPHSWSLDVVICDPWRGEVVDAPTIARRGWQVDTAFHRQ